MFKIPKNIWKQKFFNEFYNWFEIKKSVLTFSPGWWSRQMEPNMDLRSQTWKLSV